MVNAIFVLPIVAAAWLAPSSGPHDCLRSGLRSAAACAADSPECALLVLHANEVAGPNGRELEAMLSAAGLPLQTVSADAIARVASTSRVRALFELSCTANSGAVMEAAEEHDADLFRWTTGVGMFKRYRGSFFSSAYLAAGSSSGISEDVVTEENGWGYLAGDEPMVVDVAEMSDGELAMMLDLPKGGTLEQPAGSEAAAEALEADAAPAISELGYGLESSPESSPEDRRLDGGAPRLGSRAAAAGGGGRPVSSSAGGSGEIGGEISMAERRRRSSRGVIARTRSESRG